MIFQIYIQKNYMIIYWKQKVFFLWMNKCSISNSLNWVFNVKLDKKNICKNRKNFKYKINNHFNMPKWQVLNYFFKNAKYSKWGIPMVLFKYFIEKSFKSHWINMHIKEQKES